MKLLASDYDGTFFTSKLGVKLNVSAVERFRNSGNKFAIVTGRTFTSIKREIDAYDIPYDYLSCNDGSIVYDNNNNILDVKYLKAYEVRDIVYYLNNLKNPGYVKNILFYNEYNKFFPLSNQYNNIVEIGVQINPFKNTREHIEILRKIVSGIEIYQYPNILFIKKTRNKSIAIEKIIQSGNIQKDNVFTIGDAKNDYEMIRDYNGYNILFSNPKLSKVSNGTVMSVRRLIKKINK